MTFATSLLPTLSATLAEIGGPPTICGGGGRPKDDDPKLISIDVPKLTSVDVVAVDVVTGAGTIVRTTFSVYSPGVTPSSVNPPLASVIVAPPPAVSTVNSASPAASNFTPTCAS